MNQPAWSTITAPVLSSIALTHSSVSMIPPTCLMNLGSTPFSACLWTTVAHMGKLMSVTTMFWPRLKGIMPKAVFIPVDALGRKAISDSLAPKTLAKSRLLFFFLSAYLLNPSFQGTLPLRESAKSPQYCFTTFMVDSGTAPMTALLKYILSSQRGKGSTSLMLIGVG